MDNFYIVHVYYVKKHYFYVRIMPDKYEYRCDNCKKLLFKGNVETGFVEIKCSKCGHLQQFLTGIKDSLQKLKAFITKSG